MANEKRLIDANAFECVCVNGKSDDFCNGVLYVLDMIDTQPTVEAVEVCRCKDCKHRHETLSGLKICSYHITMDAKDDQFCSYGERREGE